MTRDALLVVNAGSSSLKFQLYDTAGEVPDLSAAVREMRALLAGQGGHRITAIGHRVVHGGPDHAAPVLIDADVLARLETFQSRGAAGASSPATPTTDPSPGSAPSPSARAARSILR